MKNSFFLVFIYFFMVEVKAQNWPKEYFINFPNIPNTFQQKVSQISFVDQYTLRSAEDVYRRKPLS